MKKYVIIVAGGQGRRMNSEVPKQFLLLHGKPVIVYTIETFQEYDPDMEYIITLPSQNIEYWVREILKNVTIRKVQFTKGGEERFHSVKNGLALVTGDDALVAIHDSVRPLVSMKTIQDCFATAASKGCAIPCIEVNESVRAMDDKGSSIVGRTNLRLIQTPQVFHAGLLKMAYMQEYSTEFTDDASVFEKAGHPVYLVDGNQENIKITTTTDMEIAKAFLEFMGRT